MQQRDINRGLQRRRDLVHGIGGEQQGARPCLLQALCSVGQKFACGLPVTTPLQLGDFSEVHGMQQQRRRVQAAQLFAHALIE